MLNISLADAVFIVRDSWDYRKKRMVFHTGCLVLGTFYIITNFHWDIKNWSICESVSGLNEWKSSWKMSVTGHWGRFLDLSCIYLNILVCRVQWDFRPFLSKCPTFKKMFCEYCNEFWYICITTNFQIKNCEGVSDLN